MGSRNPQLIVGSRPKSYINCSWLTFSWDADKREREKKAGIIQLFVHCFLFMRKHYYFKKGQEARETWDKQYHSIPPAHFACLWVGAKNHEFRVHGTLGKVLRSPFSQWWEMKERCYFWYFDEGNHNSDRWMCGFCMRHLEDTVNGEWPQPWHASSVGV